jgi:endo-beta-N-acetylglucosaminidase D
MKELLPFFTALANPNEAYLSENKGTNDDVELIIAYNTHKDEHLKQTAEELDRILEGNAAQVRLQATDVPNNWEIIVTSQGEINDSFTLFNVNIHHLAMNVIEEFLERSQQVKLTLKHNQRYKLNAVFNLDIVELQEESPFLNMPIDLVNATIESSKKNDEAKG